MSSTTARGPDRRERLIGAARIVAREKGVAGLTVRAVATQANVSTGSVLYHFDTFDELITAAVEGVMEEFYDRRRALAEGIPDVQARLLALIEAGIPDEISDDLRLLYESAALVRIRSHLAPLARSVVERQVQLYLTTLDIGSGLAVFRPRLPTPTIARHIVALEDAYDFYPVIGIPGDRAQIRESVVAYAELALDTPLRPRPDPTPRSRAGS
ncbi:MAG: TetR/AcrR family transcriptional regulator [Phycicoccus sp.]|nr:TetR/AcrR family transcriptional regulator [Phycicoccus sp.]